MSYKEYFREALNLGYNDSQAKSYAELKLGKEKREEVRQIKMRDRLEYKVHLGKRRGIPD